MSNYAVDKKGKAVFADYFDAEEWQNLKQNYSIGDYLMPCCMAAAVPKTSPNYRHFFSHYADECATSPESVWHLSTKESVVKILRNFNVDAALEYSQGVSKGGWKADVYFEKDDKKIVIEIQKSYQHLKDYLKRQERYKLSGIEAYWLLYPPRYLTLTKALGKHKLKFEYGGVFPEGSFFACLPELPVACYEIGNDSSIVKGNLFINCSLDEWLKAILENRFKYDSGLWKVLLT